MFYHVKHRDHVWVCRRWFHNWDFAWYFVCYLILLIIYLYVLSCSSCIYLDMSSLSYLYHKNVYVFEWYSSFLILMLWYRQAMFESKGDKSSSSAECSILTLKVRDTKSSADWMTTHKPTELSRIKQNLEPDGQSLWWASIQPTWFHFRFAFTPASGNIHVCC